MKIAPLYESSVYHNTVLHKTLSAVVVSVVEQDQDYKTWDAATDAGQVESATLLLCTLCSTVLAYFLHSVPQHLLHSSGSGCAQFSAKCSQPPALAATSTTASF